jgi:hypothetical protein
MDDSDGIPDNPHVITDAEIPAQRIWPCPGSVLRVDAYTFMRAPYAVHPASSINMVIPDPANDFWKQRLVFDPEWVAKLSAQQETNWVRNGGELQKVSGDNTVQVSRVYSQGWAPYLRRATYDSYGALNPQPIADRWGDFATGDSRVNPASANLAWFRIYREMPSDHNNDGNPWYDRVPLTGHGVFIITVGAGGTRGHRFWSSGDAGFSSSVEPVTASQSGSFPDESLFRQLQAAERRMWFRVEWTAQQGGDGDPSGIRMLETSNSDPTQGALGDVAGVVGSTSRDEHDGHLYWRSARNPMMFGTIKWIQRLEREPPAW